MNVPILPTISTSCIVISAILVAIGWRLIWKDKLNSIKSNVMGCRFCRNVLYYLC